IVSGQRPRRLSGVARPERIVATTSLSVLTWNINRRAASVLERIDSLADLPDVVTLQEVNHLHEAPIRRRLEDRGYSVVSSVGSAATTKRYGNMIAAAGRLARCDPSSFGFPWRQLVCHATLDRPGARVNVVTVHIPNGSGNGWKKIDALE